jgi:hypothetical protein
MTAAIFALALALLARRALAPMPLQALTLMMTALMEHAQLGFAVALVLANLLRMDRRMDV